ncbi:class I SAM-dependent methyltransferase [Goodfellowiella coeruleoviolacea]|uniref:Methyltransferase domain-containing protein n=1 Tax=Goodfellowiella coeruleoviolacea TaxID=334858 RepID=A0AAE3GF84_9PSEU|nr:class I SAM-dependent methyltransferase [Goodfellowiella coeruleoviolacea]MCP2166623.1 Methyltransferase domain-containing protein [Goodfellowiella coeruleoviolacea]
MGNPDHDEIQRMLRANERNWDARTSVHVDSEFYDLAGVRAGVADLPDFEWAELGDLTGKQAVHLQCHLGTDTLSLARAGAEVLGLDISAESVRAATRLAEQVGVPVRYVHANVYDAVVALDGARFDLVYTGKGALVWLPDLDRWARVVADLLRPGGQLYLVEFHPLVTSAADDSEPGAPRLVYDFFGGRTHRWDQEFSYTDGAALPADARTTFQWEHGIGEVVTALARAGLRVSSVTERTSTPWKRWPWLVESTVPGWWTLPPDAPMLPLTYSLRAVREG